MWNHHLELDHPDSIEVKYATSNAFAPFANEPTKPHHSRSFKSEHYDMSLNRHVHCFADKLIQNMQFWHIINTEYLGENRLLPGIKLEDFIRPESHPNRNWEGIWTPKHLLRHFLGFPSPHASHTHKVLEQKWISRAWGHLYDQPGIALRHPNCPYPTFRMKCLISAYLFVFREVHTFNRSLQTPIFCSLDLAKWECSHCAAQYCYTITAITHD